MTEATFSGFLVASLRSFETGGPHRLHEPLAVLSSHLQSQAKVPRAGELISTRSAGLSGPTPAGVPE